MSARSPALPAASRLATQRASRGAAMLVPLSARREPLRDPAAITPAWTRLSSLTNTPSGLRQLGFNTPLPVGVIGPAAE
jgi:hypothetical protein